MKRILCLLSNLNAGGAETFIMKVYRNLDRQKYQIDFCISVKEKCFYEDEIMEKGGRIFRIPTRSSDFFERKKQLACIVRDNQYKYVLSVASSPVSFIDLWVAKKNGAEKCSFRSSNSNDSGSLKLRLLNYFCRKAFMKHIDVKIAPSDLAAIFTFGRREYRNGKVDILNNGLEPSIFNYSEDGRNKIRREYNLSSELVVGHVGRFNTQKNHTFLIDIFYEINQLYPNSRLLLVGEGNLLEDTKKKICSLSLSDRVIFTGVRTDIPDILSAMDVFLFPSLFEGMPNSVIEAQACGLPCLISDTITKEANYLGLVNYCSLRMSPQYWAREVLKMKDKRVCSTEKLIKEKGYDIKDIAQKFADIVY